MVNTKNHLTASDLVAITIIERVGSVFSLLGCIFIIVTFSFSKAFHKPINRLVFYASFGNMLSNVGTLMAMEYLGNLDTFGCQFQAFLIQMFMPADAFWTLAMAFNVYLTFYFKFDAARLRRMEIWYFLLCYGVPFVPALTYIFVTTPTEGRMYGDATLWCWVSSKWDVFRIATFYGPVWVVIVVTFFIYIRAGGEIYKKRKQLRQFSSSTNRDPEPLTMDDPYSIKTTEVTVTTEDASTGEQGISLGPIGRGGSEAGPVQQQYSVTITSDARNKRESYNDLSLPIQTNAVVQPPQSARQNGKAQKRRQEQMANNAAWAYTKCAILFFTAILITWIPSSANRVYSVINANDISIPLQFMSAIVLPLQGFWNALIYIVTSWKACELFFSEIGDRVRHGNTPKYLGDYNERRSTAFKTPTSRGAKTNYETESMTELATSTSNDDQRQPSM